MQFRYNKYIFKKSTLKKGLLLSLLIGTILNIINQGNYIIGLEWNKINFLKLCLTYMTPFFVSVYSTSTALLENNQFDN